MALHFASLWNRGLGNKETALKFHSWNECQYQGEIDK